MTAATPRKTTEVAVGVLLRPDRAVLLADRPAGKPYPGYWEFPGGKIEPGETVEHALARELHEELGVDIGSATPWVTFEFDYPHAYVRLHFCRVYDWRGTPHGREGQRFAFFRVDDPLPQPLLPAAVPAMRWLALPEIALRSRVAAIRGESWLAALERDLAAGVRLVIVDEPTLAAGAREALMAAVTARAQACGAQVVCAWDAPGIDGRLLSVDGPQSGRWQPGARRSADAASRWTAVSVASRDELARAARCGCDFALAGPVLPRAGRAADAAIGWHGATALLRDTPLPVYLHGGLQHADLERARAAGAHGIVIGA